MMERTNVPSISFLIPTLNAARVLDDCLASITGQNYPKNKIEVIIADGGSTDQTLKIAKKYQSKIFTNPLKTAESGKVVALLHAQADLVGLVDSDNILPSKNWLKQMAKPFTDSEILGSEPWKFTYRRNDFLINRYCALIGVNDPYCYFIGNYDKRSTLSGRWTGLKVEQENKGKYLKITLKPGILPTIGANGTIWRTKVLKKVVGENSYLFDTDIPYLLVSKGGFYFAKVKIGLIHLYCHQFKDFYRKQRRRVKDFFYLESKGKRETTYQGQIFKQIYFVLCVILIFPLIYQSIKGYFKKPDRAWFFHPIACLVTLWIYGTESFIAQFRKNQMDRQHWQQ